jgi:hypothetical protein
MHATDIMEVEDGQEQEVLVATKEWEWVAVEVVAEEK